MDTQRCPSCGETVRAGVQFCPNCGARQTPATPAVEPTQVLPTPSIPSDQATTPASQSPQPPLTPPPSYGTPGQLPGSSSTPPPAGNSNLRWVLIALGGLGLLAVLCIAAVGFYFFGNPSGTGNNPPVDNATAVSIAPTAAEGEDNRTATAEARQEAQTATAEARREARTATAIARATTAAQGDADAQATADALATAEAADIADAQATADAIATADALATAEAVPTPVAPPDPAVLGAAQQVFRDEFVDNRNNWFIGRFQDKEEDKIEGGVFKVIWEAKGTSYELYVVREFNNFVTDVDCVVVQGDLDGSCGIVFANNEDVGFYKFEVFNDYYRLFIVTQDQDPQILVEGDPAGIVIPNNTNRLRVVRINNEAFLYINDQLLTSYTDSTFPTGKIGVSTNSYNESGGVEVWFDNFTIWQLP